MKTIQQMFNLYQTNIFIQRGATVKGCGMEGNKAYVSLETDEIFYDLLEKWNTRTLIKK